MMPLSQLNNKGYEIFNDWYASKKITELVTSDEILMLQEQINESGKIIFNNEILIDEKKKFDSHYELGQYLNTLLNVSETDYAAHLQESRYSLWDWITVVYLDQLISDGNLREIVAYLCTEGRKSGRLYRHRCRTDYEMFSIHKEISKLVLYPKLHIGGESREQLVATNWVRYSKPIFQTAYALFFDHEKQVPKRNVSEIRDLKKWVERLDATYLIDLMSPTEIQDVLPEFMETLERSV